MTYDKFKEFLKQFNEIRSFRKRIDFANQHLKRLGAGSSRITYDIDGEKIFKLAKNNKGIAQNSEESNALAYHDYDDVLTTVFDADPDDLWVIAEKAKPVTTQRFKEITGFEMDDVYKYIANWVEVNSGRNKSKRFDVSPEVEEALNEEEFVQRIINFVHDYDQAVGDMARPSTWGEVERDGQPTIVLKDYGLSNSVHDTYYGEGIKLYEYFNSGDGNDDFLSDIGNTGMETRRGMWAIMPYSVSDGQDTINEDFVNFVKKNKKYPDKEIKGMPVLLDRFRECKNNLKEVLNTVEDKRGFYENFLSLQEFLIKNNRYVGETLLTEQEIPPVEYLSLDNKTYAVQLANEVAKKLNLGRVTLMKGGGFGFAFEVNNKVVLKLTSDMGEADAALIALRNKPKTLADIYGVYKVVDTDKNAAYFAILEENIVNKPKEKFLKIISNIDKIRPDGMVYSDILVGIRKPKRFDYNEWVEVAKKIMTENPDLDITEAERKEAYNFLIGILNIRQELIDLGIKSTDYITLDNLGYNKEGILTFFDVGGHITPEPDLPDDNIIFIPEDGSALRSTDDSIGRDDFPPYYQGGTEPPVRNNLDANAAMYNEEIEGVDVDYQLKTSTTKYGDKMYNLKSKYGSITGALHNEVTDWVDYKKYDMPEIYVEFIDATEVGKGMGKKLLLQAIDYAKKNNINYITSHSLNDYSRKTFEFLETEGVLKPFLDGVNGKTITWEITSKPIKEDLEYNHVSDATKDEYAMTEERKKAWIPGSKAVTVKQRCRLGGKADGTSDACNQGDVGNLEFSSLNEAPFEEYRGKQIYINPPTIKNLASDARGWLDLEGNLYMIDDGWNLTHSALMTPLFKRGVITDPREIMNYIASNNGIAVQRVGNTDYLAMSQGYKGTGEEKFNQFRSAIQKGQQKNPRVKFIPVEHPEASEMDLNAAYGKQSQLNEETTLDTGFIDGWNRYDILHDNEVVGEIEVSNRDNYMILNKILINPEHRGNGYAQDAMEILIDYADKNGKVIALTPDKVWGASKTKLTQWYKSLGFALNKGRNADYQVRELMIRKPKMKEGVGDKYAEKKFGIEPEFSNFEKDYALEKLKKESEDVVFYNPDNDWAIVKNPKSLKNIGRDVRGIIDKEGNLYIESFSDVIHITLVNLLRDKGGHLKMDYMDSLDEKVPSEYLTVQRLGNTNEILVGESNDAMQDDAWMSKDWRTDYKMPSKEEALPHYQKFMDAAKRKNPNIDFVTEHIAVYRRNKAGIKPPPMNEAEIMSLKDLPFKSEIENLGGKIYSVGGAVRDEFLGKESKDLDILIRWRSNE
jgi:GNAT superfamily N-acetyltransferase